jgi:hypothetical protein
MKKLTPEELQKYINGIPSKKKEDEDHVDYSLDKDDMIGRVHPNSKKGKNK